MLCDELFQEFLITVRDSASLTSIDWTHAIKKEARGSEDKDLGEVQQAEAGEMPNKEES